MTEQERDAIRWALAARLEGMREACPVVWETTYPAGGLMSVTQSMTHREGCTANPCRGYVPLPLANGEIDVGRLIKAIEAEGLSPDYYGDEEQWEIYSDKHKATPLATDPDLAVAYLKAVGDWPLKEEN